MTKRRPRTSASERSSRRRRWLVASSVTWADLCQSTQLQVDGRLGYLDPVLAPAARSPATIDVIHRAQGPSGGMTPGGSAPAGLPQARWPSFALMGRIVEASSTQGDVEKRMVGVGGRAGVLVPEWPCRASTNGPPSASAVTTTIT